MSDDHAPRHPLVRRARLLAGLGAVDGPPFVVVVAPAGYGKTTLLRDWCARDRRPSAWVTLDRRHEDPLALLRAIARAADQAASRAVDGRSLVILDDVHTVQGAAARETLIGIAHEPPAGTTIALASRAELPLPVARLRAEGRVAELRAGALAMTRAEAAELLRLHGIRLEPDTLDALMHQTEGWPAALSLAAASLGRGAPEQAFMRFDGRDRLAADYLRDEILAALGDDEREFALQTAALDTLSGPLCDATLQRTGSAAMLARLRRAGFPLVALDRSGDRVRHHRLLAGRLRAELAQTAPGLEHELHARACDWHQRAGELEPALRHALAAADVERATAVVWQGIPTAVERGSIELVEHQLGLFAADDIAARPSLALAAAAVQLAAGQGDIAECWLGAADTAAAGPPIAAGAAALRACLGRNGPEAMAADAARAAALLAPDSPGQALCRLSTGVAAHLRGDRAGAHASLQDGARRAAVRVPHVHALCLAQLALLALDEDEREEAAGLATRARAQVERAHLTHQASSALVLAVCALVRAQRGRVEDAMHDLLAAQEQLEQLTDGPGWYASQTHLALARAALRLSDVATAQRHLSAAARHADRLEGAVALHAAVRSVDAELEAYRLRASRLSTSLTGAELRILQLLPTHLSFREIGEQARVTTNTVKTQANAVYRKLDVRSRSDAVCRARELGLIDA